MTSKPEARKHHFVPRFLLRPWRKTDPNGQLNLHGYFWDQRKSNLLCKKRGLDSFCVQLDLLILRSHKLGRDALERVFFGDIDAKGAEARDILVEHGPEGLTAEQRSDFGRVLLSLEARRPENVDKLRRQSRVFIDGLDTDPTILTAMSEYGLQRKPSDIYESHSGVSMTDRALLVIQKLVDNPTVGGRLVNANWHVARLGPYDGTFVIADRPLIRLNGFDAPDAVWIIPLTPTVAFIAANETAVLNRLKRLSAQRLAKFVNVASVLQLDKFVFSIDEAHERWMTKYVRPK